MPSRNIPIAKSIDKVIRQNLDSLRKPEVLTVRPGYELAGHMLTGKPAIVATVHTKKPKTELARGEALPERIGSVPVDVREATGHQRLRAIDPAAAAVAEAYERPEEREPEWPDEREMPSGKLLSDPTSNTQRVLKKARAAQPSTDAALKARKKQVFPYTPPQGISLARRQITTTITAHVSPDAGFATLQTFLQGTRKSLVIGIYDFTSGPILSTFLSVLKEPKTLQMVLDNPAPNKTRDQTDWMTFEDLTSALKGRAKIAWALAGDDTFAAVEIFPTSYHIKVIVRDDDTLWLSSGNLNNSNQPDLSRPPHTEDRDWHLIVEDADLAKTFAAFLDNDFTTAVKHQAPNPDAIERAIEDAHSKKAKESNSSPPRPASPPKNPVAAKTFRNLSLTVTPLLTPDKLSDGTPQYLTTVMNVIQSAKQSVDIQLQYIEASKGDGSDYDKLLQALAAKSKTATVRLIVSANFADKNAEKMKAKGVDLTDLIRTQPNVHNKGYVIDGKQVIVSSQNYSPDGIELNRDAGLLLESPEIAQYFGAVFNADWTGAKPMVAQTRTPVTGVRGTNQRRKRALGAKRTASDKRQSASGKKAAASGKTIEKIRR